MKTQFELGDTIIVPFKVHEVRINHDRVIYYLRTDEVKGGKEPCFNLTITESEIEGLGCQVCQSYKVEKRLFMGNAK